MARAQFELRFDLGTIKHLGLQMYSTLPPVVSELIANAWDADAHRVEIEIPTQRLDDSSEIVVWDDGSGMTDEAVQEAYLRVGRDRREAERSDRTPKGRRVMGRKGIGKFSSFGISNEIEVETAQNGIVSRFRINFLELKQRASQFNIELDNEPPTGLVTSGTRVTLRDIQRYRTRRIPIDELRRGLARRFSILGDDFVVSINGKPLTAQERDLQSLLDVDEDGHPYLWEYVYVEIQPGTDWTVTGWIGALKRTVGRDKTVQPGIVVMARGKLVQEPFVFEATVGQQYALSYLVGELHAEFVDGDEDTIATTRNSLVWVTERNVAFKAWGQAQVNRIAREWAERRRLDNERRLMRHPLYKEFLREADAIDAGNGRTRRVADRLIREVVARDPVEDESKTVEKVIQLCIDFLQFDAFVELADDLRDAAPADIGRLVDLFREWEFVEAREMMRVTEGRIRTIERLQQLIDEDALEVPVLHNFLREFPWVLDPRWTLIADEERFSSLLTNHFPDGDLPEKDRRIDFLCVREGTQLVVVEIKRPGTKASAKELQQIEEYVHFVRDLVSRTTDDTLKVVEVVGYLLCGDTAGTGIVREKIKSLAETRIFVRRYGDLLAMVKSSHQDFLRRYDELKAAKARDRLELPPAASA